MSKQESTLDKHREELITALEVIEEIIREIKTGGPIPIHSTSNKANIGATLKINLLKAEPPIDYSKEDH